MLEPHDLNFPKKRWLAKPPQCAFVLGVSNFCVKLWHMEVFTDPENARIQRSWNFLPTADAFQALPVFSVEGFVAVQLEPRAPYQLAREFVPSARPTGIGFVSMGGPETLLRVAARHAFRNLQVPHLKMLWAMVKVPGATSRVATTEAKLVLGLMKHVLPGLLPGEYDAIAASRHMTSGVEDTWSGLLTEENVEILRESMDSCEAAEFAEEFKKARKKSKPFETASASASTATVAAASSGTGLPGTSSSSGGTGSSGDGGAVVVPARPNLKVPTLVVGDPHLTIEQARALIPQIAGCTLHLEETWHVRWKAVYPRDVLPKTVSRSFGGVTEFSSEEALNFIVRIVWGWHFECTGEPCPFE